MIPWNRGLTKETDERLRVHSERMKGNTYGFKPGNVPWNKGKKGVSGGWNRGLTKETDPRVKKHSERMRGNKLAKGTPPWNKGKHVFVGPENPNWKGGKYRNQFHPKGWDKIREKILERDEGICQLCAKPAEVVHHIDYNRRNNKPGNLISLCRSCNGKVNANRKLWTNYFEGFHIYLKGDHLFTRENICVC